ncbi:MAG: Clp protease ClpP [Blautia sp.]|nr:Clp protease ClpP [Blautia sp.]
MKHKTIRILTGPAPSAQDIPHFWNVAKNDDSAEITIYGEIVSHRPNNWITGEPEDRLYTSPEGFLEDLATIKDAANITVRINSVGGDVYTAIGIANRLKELEGNTVAIIDGIAASAATVVAMGCDTIKAYNGSMFMIHEALTELYGAYNHKALLLVNKRLEAANSAVAEQYHGKTGLEIDKIRSQMASEKWMTGREAFEEGWIDEVIDGDDPSMSITKDGSTITVNGISMSAKGFEHIPDSVPVVRTTAQISAPLAAAGSIPKVPDANKTITQKEVHTMTLEELREQSPELEEQIRVQAHDEATNTAIANERARLQAISEIAATIGDPEMVNDAMYGEGACTASELALRAMQKAARLGQNHITNTHADFQSSGAGNVASTPNAGNPDPQNKNDETEMTEAEAIAMIIGKTVKKDKED